MAAALLVILALMMLALGLDCGEDSLALKKFTGKLINFF